MALLVVNFKIVVGLEGNDSSLSVETQSEVSDKFKEVIDKVFDEDQEADVIDVDGNSVKANFISINLQHYTQKNYLQIQSYFEDNLLRVVCENESKPQPRASTSYNNSKLVFHSYVTPDYNYRIEFEAECYAVIRVNEATGVITSFSGPSMYLTYFSPSGGAVLGNLDSVNTDYEWVSSAHRGMYFYYNYRAKLEVAEMYGMKSTYYTPYYSKTIRSHY